MNNVNFTTVCCSSGGSALYAEVPCTGGTVRIIKPAVGGYRVTVFGLDNRLLEAEAEMDETEAAAVLARINA